MKIATSLYYHYDTVEGPNYIFKISSRYCDLYIQTSVEQPFLFFSGGGGISLLEMTFPLTSSINLRTKRVANNFFSNKNRII